MKKITLLAVCILTSAICHLSSYMAFSQDIHFARFWMTPLLVNPAQSGAESDLRAIINYRNQWNSVATPYSTANVSFDAKIAKKKGRKGFSAMGVTIFQDQAGNAKMKTLQGNITYAYHVYINKESTLGAGLYGGFAQRSINNADLQWMNQYDGSSYNAAMPSGEPSGGASLTYPDLGSGIHYEYGKDKLDLSAGLSIFHANRPAYSFYGKDDKLNMKITGYANGLVRLSNRNFSLVPGFIYFQQGKSSELFFGNMFRYTFREASSSGYVKGAAISLGAHYRNKDAVIPVVVLEFAQFNIGLSYDVNISKLKTASSGQGGFEISLRFVNPNPFLPKSASRI
ncbi:MAG: PorP/SprF family type IX secretion system membrane protein [Bacteroidetes bacterium]|nr:PorP/SprF family type IX secretion system membrane protein [Bacteroidota bacterium]